MNCTCDRPHMGCHRHGPQPRERGVPCVSCHRETWSIDALCDPCRNRENERSAA